jgi:hypothetical protein
MNNSAFDLSSFKWKDSTHAFEESERDVEYCEVCGMLRGAHVTEDDKFDTTSYNGPRGRIKTSDAWRKARRDKR